MSVPTHRDTVIFASESTRRYSSTMFTIPTTVTSAMVLARVIPVQMKPVYCAKPM
jgi:hypothetical protein